MKQKFADARIMLIAAMLIGALAFAAIPITAPAQEGVPLPRRSDMTPPITVNSAVDALTSEPAALKDIPDLLMECLAFKVAVNKSHRFGVEWEKDKLEAALGKPLAGQFRLKEAGSQKLDVETLILKDPDKFLQYLSRFGEARLIYKQMWSQSIGEQVNREYQTIMPFTTSFGAKEGAPSSQQTYTQSSVLGGIKLALTLNGIQLSDEFPIVDFTYEIEMKDSYKTKDNLYAVNRIISADTTTVPVSHSVIQTKLFSHDEILNQYIFVVTPRSMK